VQQYLGHERIETTMIYIHVIREMCTPATSPLDALLRGTLPGMTGQQNAKTGTPLATPVFRGQPPPSAAPIVVSAPLTGHSTARLPGTKTSTDCSAPPPSPVAALERTPEALDSLRPLAEPPAPATDTPPECSPPCAGIALPRDVPTSVRVNDAASNAHPSVPTERPPRSATPADEMGSSEWTESISPTEDHPMRVDRERAAVTPAPEVTGKPDEETTQPFSGPPLPAAADPALPTAARDSPREALAGPVQACSVTGVPLKLPANAGAPGSGAPQAKLWGGPKVEGASRSPGQNRNSSTTIRGAGKERCRTGARRSRGGRVTGGRRTYWSGYG